MTDAGQNRRAADTAGNVSSLESNLWRKLGEADGTREFAAAWLGLQCRIIDDAQSGLLMLAGKEAGVYEPIAVWPENAGKVPHLIDAAKSVVVERRPILRGGLTGEHAASSTDRIVSGQTIAAYPVTVDERIVGAVAVGLGGFADPRVALRQLQWGAPGLRERVQSSQVALDRDLLHQSRATLDLLAAGLAQEGFQPAALAVVTELALRFRCDRVSLGFIRGRTVRVATISHTARFRRQMDLVSKLTAAMNEAVDQRCVIVFPCPTRNIATAAHADLSRLQTEATLLTVPIFSIDRFIGALTLERARDLPFEAGEMEVLEAVASALGPMLQEKRLNDRWLVVKAGEALRLQIVRLLGPGHLVRKLLLIGAIAAAAFFYVARDTYRVDADAQIEGLVRRAVVASYDGFIREANVRAGDTVAAGQVLASFDDRDLTLERLRWTAERQQRVFEYDKALASRQPAAINVTRSQIDQADAQIKLLNEQLARISVRAPISGLVVSGDLSQLIGAAANRGQVLFEIAPLDGYRVILSLDERQIGSIKTGQTGALVTNALPGEPFAFRVDKVTPIAEAKAGRNLFRVEGLLSQNSDRLRPGMEGVAKINIAPARLIWIWTHSLVDWLRLWAWQWWP